MASSRWQKQNTHIQNIVRIIAFVISILLSILFLSLKLLDIVNLSLIFLTIFMITEVSWLFILKNHFADSLVRVLKFDYEELDWDFRMLFKNNQIRFYRELKDDSYRYEFPGHSLFMTVQRHWISRDQLIPAATKITLHKVIAKNEAFAQTLADTLDDMAKERVNR